MTKFKKIPVDELLRLACCYAEADREDFAYCHEEGTLEREEAMEFVRQIHAYRMKRWGKSQLEAILDRATPIDVREIAQRPDSGFTASSHTPDAPSPTAD
jgi:hypothetical protein